MGDGAGRHGKDLRTLLTSPDADVRAEAFKTLLAIRDPSVITTVAENCRPSGTEFLGIPIESLRCLRDVAVFGEDARSTGSHLMKFLVSPNAEEVAGAVSVLGYTDHDAAIPRIEQQLRSQDWRVVYSAARSTQLARRDGSYPRD
jgi:HEAT repeat protein